MGITYKPGKFNIVESVSPLISIISVTDIAVEVQWIRFGRNLR